MSTTVVDYASPGTSRQRGGTLAIAFGCALLPMAAGLIVTVAWLLTQATTLEMIGFFVILVGVVMFFVGMLCCLFETARGLRSQRAWRTWLPRVALAAGLLLANFPLAAACVSVTTLSRVHATNNSAAVVTNLVVSDPAGNTWQLGPIAPGKSTWRMMWLDGEGAVTYTATTNLTSGAVTSSGTLDGYITGPGTGGTYRITINPDGSSTPP